MESLDSLLQRTSRTFALAIPLLPEPTRTEVMLAYLVFRIADTLEDGERLATAERRAALNEFAELLAAPAPRAIQRFTDHWLAQRPCDEPAYLDLLAATPRVMAAVETLSPAAQQAILHHARRSTLGMRAMLESAERRLATLEQLRRYCYYVAGIVGEMLTDIFELQLEPGDATVLTSHAAAFGEALQLVNILKDEQEDAQRGRYYLPADTPRAEIFALARRDLDEAQHYVAALEQRRAPPGLLAFTLLPLRLASLALDCVEQHGPGAKVPRSEVFRVLRTVFADCHLDP